MIPSCDYRFTARADICDVTFSRTENSIWPSIECVSMSGRNMLHCYRNIRLVWRYQPFVENVAPDDSVFINPLSDVRRNFPKRWPSSET